MRVIYAFQDQTKLNTIGAVVIGVTFAIILGGITIQQAAIYYRQFPKDKKRVKVFVGVVTVLNFAHTGCVINVLYYFVVDTWMGYIQADNVAKNVRLPVTTPLSILLAAIIIMAVQGFYCYRIYVLSHWISVTLTILFGSLVETGLLIAIAILIFIIDTEKAFTIMRPAALSWFGTTAVIDVVTVTSVLYYLICKRGIISNDTSLRERLSIIVLQTNLLGSAAVICCGSVIISTHGNLWGMSFFFSTAKLYQISFMTSLNSRPAHDEPTFTNKGSTVTTTYIANSPFVFPELKRPFRWNDENNSTTQQNSNSAFSLSNNGIDPSPPQSSVYFHRQVSVNIDDYNGMELLQPKVYKTFRRQPGTLDVDNS